MQLVGETCGICNERIRAALDAAGCRACERAWHLECLAHEGREDDCPSCDRSFSAQEEEAERASAAALVEGQARGRRAFFGSVWLFALAAVGGAAANAVWVGACAASPHVVFAVLPILVLAASRQTHLGLPLLGTGFGLLVKVHDHGTAAHTHNEYVRLGIAIGAFLGFATSSVFAYGLRAEALEIVAAQVAAAVVYLAAFLLSAGIRAAGHARAADGG